MTISPHFMTTLCNTFKCLARNTWDRIHDSRQVNFQLKEETFIDINMLTIKLLHDSEVKTKVFTKIEEGNNGADWEWWFRGLIGNWIGFRVQAKIINLQSNKFDHLHYYKTDRNGARTYQCDKLIQNALTSKNPKIPIYCFFIQTDIDSYLNNLTCQTIPFVKDLYGCSVTSAFNVKQLRATNSKHLTDLQKDLRPWHCLVCCSGFGDGDFISNIKAYVKTNFKFDKNVAKELKVSIPEDFSTQEPPDYVLAILENDSSESIKAPDKEIDGVIIITEKE